MTISGPLDGDIEFDSNMDKWKEIITNVEMKKEFLKILKLRQCNIKQ